MGLSVAAPATLFCGTCMPRHLPSQRKHEGTKKGRHTFFGTGCLLPSNAVFMHDEQLIVECFVKLPVLACTHYTLG